VPYVVTYGGTDIDAGHLNQLHLMLINVSIFCVLKRATLVISLVKISTLVLV
jgi:hypothetical protein